MLLQKLKDAFEIPHHGRRTHQLNQTHPDNLKSITQTLENTQKLFRHPWRKRDGMSASITIFDEAYYILFEYV